MTRGRTISTREWKQGVLPSTCVLDGDRMVFYIPQRLESPNTWGTGRAAWRKTAARTSLRVRLATAYLEAFNKLLTMRPAGEQRRMRLDVERLVPSARNFIKDGDNLVFCTKPLRDALKDLGLIREDSERWLSAGVPEQRVSSDGNDWTVVTLSPHGGAGD